MNKNGCQDLSRQKGSRFMVSQINGTMKVLRVVLSGKFKSNKFSPFGVRK